jgi:hypothetical protein
MGAVSPFLRCPECRYEVALVHDRRTGAHEVDGSRDKRARHGRETTVRTAVTTLRC